MSENIVNLLMNSKELNQNWTSPYLGKNGSADVLAFRTYYTQQGFG